MNRVNEANYSILLEAVKIIATKFMTPDEIRKFDSGLSYEENLEMAYENIQSVASEALMRVEGA